MKLRNIGSALVLVYPYGFFDGAPVDQLGGAGIIIAINNVHTFYFKLGCGLSTNTRAELLLFDSY